MPVETRGISCCFDRESERMLKDFRKNGLEGTSSVILETLGKDAIAGATVLELGCGFGAISMELVKQGAASAVGVDLSPSMIRLGKALAEERGLSQSVSFELGDAAVAKLAKSDIVILDAVLCCYPDVATLVNNSSAATGRYYAISVPDDRRLATKLLRMILPLQAAVFRRGGFRFVVPASQTIRKGLEGKGFRLVSSKAAGWIWSVFVFAAPGAS